MPLSVSASSNKVLVKPIIAGRLNDYQIVAVGNTIHWSKKAKTFVDFLGDYIKRKLGPKWGNAEIAKLFEQRHTLLQWYDSYCRYQMATLTTQGEVSTAEMTGVVACYIGTAYSLYLLDHNVELQARLVRRLKNLREFQTDLTTKHCEFAAVSRTGKKNWVEAKMRAVVGFFGKDRNDGTTDPNPLSQMIPHLNNALRKPATDERLIFIDLNTDPVLSSDGKPDWAQPAFTRLEQFEARELKAGQSAYVFLTNTPFHRMLDAPLHAVLAAFGLGIPDFNRPGNFRLSEMYQRKQKHIDAHQIADAFAKYPQLPATFDGSLPSESLDGKPRLMIGDTYLFTDVKNLVGTDSDLLGTVTSAAVNELEKAVYFSVTDQVGRSFILNEPMTDQQIADYKAHPEAYFGKLQHVGGKVNNPYELFEFFMESYKGLTREALLERFTAHLDTAGFACMSNDELLAIYCEGMVAGSRMFRDAG